MQRNAFLCECTGKNDVKFALVSWGVKCYNATLTEAMTSNFQLSILSVFP